MSLQTVEDMLTTALRTDPNIGPLVATRVYVEPLPQNVALPAITFQRISTIRNYVRTRGGQFADMGWARFQISIWDNSDASSYQRVSQLAQYLIQAMRTFNAYWSGVAGSNRVLSQMVEPVADLQPPGYRARLDLKIWFSDNT